MDMDLVPIGVVRSRISDRRLMPPTGAPAEIHVFPEYEDGLLLIQENSHIWVIGWFDEADRERLQIIRTTYEPARRRRGVFGLRSMVRPNSLSLSPTRLLEASGNVLRVDSLDLVDGTRVVDIKRYSPSYDAIFSARSSRDRYLLDKADPARIPELEVEAAHFHGEHCAFVITGARLVQYVSLNWNIMPKEAGLLVTVGLDPEISHLVDAVQGLTAATFGTGRLCITSGCQIIFEYESRRLVVEPLPVDGVDLETLRQVGFPQLFTLVEE